MKKSAPKILEEEEFEAEAEAKADRMTPTERSRRLAGDNTPALYKGRKVGNKFTDERRAVFLFMLAETGQRRRAAMLAGVDTSAIYYRTNRNSQGYDSEFAEMVVEADEIYNETVDGEIARRGKDGWKEPVFGGKDKDKIVGYVRKYSDNLLLQHAKSRMARYRDKVTVTQETKTAAPMTEALSSLSHDQRSKLRAFMESVEPKSDDVVDADFEDVTLNSELEAAIEDI